MQRTEDLDPFDVWSMCSKKKMYKSKDLADKLAYERNLRTYFCPICQNWHLTKQL